MFLISKIVRGRRLLHELEVEDARRESEDGAQLANATAKVSGALSRQQQRVGAKNATVSGISVPSTSGTELSPQATSSPNAPNRSKRKAQRQKTDSSLPDDEGIKMKIDGRPALFMRRTSSMPSVNDVLKAGNIFYNYDRKLNKMQKRSLRFTWQRLQTRNGGKKVESVFEEVYEKLLKQQPILRDMFTTRTFLSAMSKNDVATLRDHARITVKMIDHAIKSFDANLRQRNEFSELEPRYIGRAHGKLRPYGFIGNFWELLGETIIDVVLAQEAVRDLPGAGQAWVLFTACLVDQLRVGFDESRNFTDDLLERKSSVVYNENSNNDSLDSTDSNILEYIPECKPLNLTYENTSYVPPIQCPAAAVAPSYRRRSRNDDVCADHHLWHEEKSTNPHLCRACSKDIPGQRRSSKIGKNAELDDLALATLPDSYL
uniref:GLOBIN domain-containing protein n=1 Tax=Syphacia muris TaxID=451379 RepID=A0A0N5AN65_9BILA